MSEPSLEQPIRSALDRCTKYYPVGKWSRSIIGVGPMRADSRRAIWRFAGLDPSVEKRPSSRELKTLCWKLGESFAITKGHERSVYGPVYDQGKVYEMLLNDQGR